MPKFEITFDVPNSSVIALPDQLLVRGGRYSVESRDGDIYVWGNSDGLRYLAEVLAQLAVGGYTKTLHVHLPLDSAHAAQPESGGAHASLVIFAADDGRG